MATKRTLFNELMTAARAKAPDFSKRVADTLKAHRPVAPKKPLKDPYYLVYQLLALAPALLWLREGEVWSEKDAEQHVAVSKSDVQTTVYFDRKRLVVASLRQLKDEMTSSIGGTSKRFDTLAKAQEAWNQMLVKFRIVAAPAKAPKVAKKADVSEAALMRALAANPDDTKVLSVLADLWQERGEPRGEFIHLCLLKNPTKEQVERREALKKAGGKLVGPAREFMYRWELADNGLVSGAFVQPDKLVDGLEALAALNPRLMLDVSAFKNAKVVAAVGALSLAAFETLSLPALNDKQLATIAPALKGVRKLHLMCRGFADTYFTPVGLRAVADQVERLEALKIDFYRAENEPNGPPRPLLPPIAEYADLIASHPAFATLKSLDFPGANAKTFKSMKNLRTVRVKE